MRNIPHIESIKNNIIITENLGNNSNNIPNKIYTNKKAMLNNQDQISDSRIILVNCLLDFKNFLKLNFIESYKGFFMIALCSAYYTNRKRPFIYNIKNNYSFTNSLITKNKVIKVNPLGNNINNSFFIGIKNSEKNTYDKVSFRFTYSFGYMQVNKIYNTIITLGDSIRSVFENKKIQHNKSNINSNENSINNQDDNTSRNLNKLEILTGIDVKLCGIKSLSKEGFLLANKLIHDKSSKIYIQFNHILYMDSPEIYCWIYIINKKYSFSKINLNIMLLQQGLGLSNQVKLVDIYDEKIYYNYADLLDAERTAKEKAFGMWGGQKSKVVRESSVLNEKFSAIFDRLSVRLNMKKWQKSILNK